LNAGEPSHARERRWPADFEINVNSRRPVMRDVLSLQPIRSMALATMNQNPYESGPALSAAPRTSATRGMIWAGFITLLLAGLCLVATVLGMMWSFDATATSSTTPHPSDLARGINKSLIPSIAAVPLALAGITLLIAGFVRRRPVADT